jgi:hypothetical protein
MARDDAYFQFPLRYITAETLTIRDCHDRRRNLKYIGDSTEERMRACVNYSSWITLRKTSVEKLSFEAESYRKRKPNSVNHTGPLSESLKRVLGVANMLNYTWPSISDTRATDELEEWGLHENERQQKGWMVRIRTDIAWDIINHAEHWPENKLRTLAALYAIIGTDGIKRVTYGKIRAMAAGASSPKDAEKRGIKLVPERTVRDWLDKLYDRGLFRLCRHNGHRYYALSGSYESDAEFAAAVLRFNQPRKRRQVLDTADLTAPSAGTQETAP